MSGGNHPHGDCRDCAAQRAEIERMCEERDSAQRCIEKLTATLGHAENAARMRDEYAENLTARVAALEAVERAAREYRAEIADARGDHPGIREWKRKQDALDAALAALEVPRG